MSVLSSAAVALPVWARGNVVVEGPDEDAFTLLVRAGELLRSVQPPRPGLRAEVRSIRLITSLSGEARGEVFEAWGLPSVELTTYPDTPKGAADALSAALDESPGELDGPSWVVAVQVASAPGAGVEDPPRQSAVAVALAFDHGSAKIPDNGPPPRHLVTGTGEKASGAAPPRLLGFRSSPGAPAELLLHILDAALQGEQETTTAWVHASPEKTAVRHFLDGRTVPVAGYPVPEGRTWLQVPDEAWRARAGVPLGAVSQGAYLSRESYLSARSARWRLEGERCSGCGGFSLPPAGRCHHCGAREGLRRGRLPRQHATLESATVIHKGAQPTEFDWHQETYGDYTVGLVRFPEEGPLLTFQLTDQQPASTPVGQEVDLVLRRLYPQEGAWRYGLKAVLRG